MLNTTTVSNESIRKERRLFILEDRDLLTQIMGRSSAELSVRSNYPYIVDWQMSEENENEPQKVH